MNFNVWRIVILALPVAMSACSSKKDEEATLDAASEQAFVISSAQEVSKDEVKKLAALVDFIVAQAAALPRAEFEPAALAKQLGKDPQVHFEWVRDKTWWAPYRGLLRGSQGVMLDRVGSNLDRAVLLGDLLRRSGHTVRLAHAQLPESRARELLTKVEPIPDLQREPGAKKTISDERRRALDVILPGQDQIDESKRRVAEAESLGRLQADQLYSAVKSAAKPDSNEDKLAIAALRDHWWVEREERGRWVAMDVLLPDSTPGETLATAVGVSAWDPRENLPTIPDSEWHTVRIRVIVERYQDGVTTEGSLLETILRPAEILDKPITLFHQPKPWPDSLPDRKTDPNAVGNAAVSVREWLPVLRVGGDLVVQSGVTDGGDIIADPVSSQRDISATGGGGFMSGFGEALGGGDTAASSMTAEWIDYEIHVPGESTQRVRRPVFDVLGPVNRAEKTAGIDTSTNDLLIMRYQALLGMTDIMLQPCAFSEDFVAHLASRSIVANQVALRELSREPSPDKARQLATGMLGRMELWGPLPQLAFWRSELGGRAGSLFIDRPNVLNYRIGRSAVNADRVAIQELVDVASNSTGVRTGTGREAFEMRLQQGVADTIAESLILGGDIESAENAASFFAMIEGEIGSNVLIGPREIAAVRELGWSTDAAARIAEDVGSGYMAVALRQPVLVNERERVGWWRIDPSSGETIGVLDTGFHGTSEDVEIRQHINALQNFLHTNERAIRTARGMRVLTPGQSLLLRAAQAAERAIEAARGVPW
jgi:hypothetical protein